jgi:nucleotide-binding universal stress UspA family protein
MSVLPVVAGVDESQASRAAAGYAAAEARRRSRPLVLVHGFTWPFIYPPLTAEHDLTDPGPRAKASELLADTAAELRRDYPDLPIRTRMQDGHATAVLAANSLRAELIVVGHRGSGGFAGLLAGSVAVQIASHAHCPVIVVRAVPPAEDAPVIVGVDGSAGARVAARFAFETAEQRCAPLLVMCAWPAGQAWPEWANASDPALPTPEPVAVSLGEYPDRYPDVKYKVEMVRAVSPAAALVSASTGAGLVVVGSRGLGGLRGLLLGSVGRTLIDHALCPVAVVREHG